MKVLSIDGGGIRGLIPALLLCEIEERTGRRIAELFDLIAGTSTGGVLACALTIPGDNGRPKYSARELVRLYENEGPRIFDRGLLKQVFSLGGLVDERYEDDGLNAALAHYLGDHRLSHCLTDVLVTAYDIQDRFAFFFRSSRAREDPTYDFELCQVARATSAAPTYFEPFEVTDVAGSRTYPLVDGGVFAVNPAACAFAESDGQAKLVASLGTGAHTRHYQFHDARWWGSIEWARPVLDMVFDGMGETTDFILSTLLGEHYVRLQVELDEASDDLDDASDHNLARLRAAAARIIRERDHDIERLCAQLMA